MAIIIESLYWSWSEVEVGQYIKPLKQPLLQFLDFYMSLILTVFTLLTCHFLHTHTHTHTHKQSSLSSLNTHLYMSVADVLLRIHLS